MYLFTVFLPLLSFFTFLLLKNFVNKNFLIYFSVFNIFLSSFFSIFILNEIINTNNSINLDLFNWLSSGKLLSTWSLHFDFLTILMIFVVNTVSFLVQFYSIGYMKEDKSIIRFYCYLNLFTFFMLVLVTSNNLLQLYLGWEGVGLCSYLLIGFWFYKDSASNAALKAFIVNRVGDMFFILGIILIYITFDSIYFSDIFTSYINGINTKANFLTYEIDKIDVICTLLFLGAMGKSAQLGLHTWLPDAMEGPTPVSALIHAATMVTAGVFLICKMSLLFNGSIYASNLVIFVGSATAIFAATVALTQNDIKKIIAYSTCSQLGFMFIAAGFSMYNLAIFHLLTHAFFKSLLFLGAGSVINILDHEQNIKKMGKLWNKVPLTYIIMLIGSLALCGLPFFSGYYSKELIINSGLTSNLFLSKYVYFISILVVALTSMYSFRLIYYVFHGSLNFSNSKYEKIKESSFFFIFPLLILSFFAIFSGYFFKDFFINNQYVDLWINSNVATLANFNFHHDTNLIYFIPTFIAFFGILLILYFNFYNKNFVNHLKIKFHRIYNFFLNKWYFDDLYKNFFVNKTINFSNNLWKKIDIGLIDKLGPNNLALTTKNFSKFLSYLQSGYLYHYVFSFVIGMVILISFIIFFI